VTHLECDARLAERLGARPATVWGGGTFIPPEHLAIDTGQSIWVWPINPRLVDEYERLGGIHQ
jgi:hypothetical protein